MPSEKLTYKIIKSVLIFAIAIILVPLIILKTPLAKYPISIYLSHALRSDISIERGSLSFTKGVKAENIEIRNKKGLYCSIKNAYIKCNFFNLLKRELDLNYSFRSVKFFYPSSEIIRDIAGLFAIEPVQLLKFNTVDGLAYFKRNEIIIKDLSAAGEDVNLFINGTTKENKYINYNLRLTLSSNITSRIPEGIRKIFFKEEEEFSTAELYLSGSIKKPSINFSTPIFKLRIK